MKLIPWENPEAALAALDRNVAFLFTFEKTHRQVYLSLPKHSCSEVCKSVIALNSVLL